MIATKGKCVQWHPGWFSLAISISSSSSSSGSYGVARVEM